MNASSFQEGTKKTWNATGTKQEQLNNCALGLIGETGEVADHFKKVIFHHDTKRTTLDLEYEIGDCLFYAAVVCTLHGVDFGDVLHTAVNKYLRESHQSDVIAILERLAISMASTISFLKGDNAVEYLLAYLINLVELALTCGLSLGEIMYANHVKLTKKRYPDGFSPEASQNRTV